MIGVPQMTGEKITIAGKEQKSEGWGWMIGRGFTAEGRREPQRKREGLSERQTSVCRESAYNLFWTARMQTNTGCPQLPLWATGAAEP